ncbi:MAG TPA: hypothetical protein VII56_06360 [Rhizomicrobium sp.]
MRILFVAAVIATCLSVPAFAADDSAAMRATANGFYGVYQTFHPSDGVPDGQGRARYQPFVSPALDALLTQAGDAEERYAKANKDSPPLIEGDLFSSLFEGATGVIIGACSGDGHSGRCAANLTHAEPGAKPTSWTDAVELVNTQGGWRVNDVVYGGAWDFGNKGKLSDTLKQVIGFQ